VEDRMFLKVKGFKLPDKLQEIAVNDLRDPTASDLVPLERSGWPEEVKADIVLAFKEIGLESPLRQKLVEPYALSFGGQDDNGEALLGDVKWDKVTLYFQWEAASWGGKQEEAEAFQQKAIKKYGHRFNHYSAYDEL